MKFNSIQEAVDDIFCCEMVSTPTWDEVRARWEKVNKLLKAYISSGSR